MWLILLGGTFAFLVFRSWRRWPHVLVDYGLQLYTPWQLSEGKVLYRDVAYLAGGPLSQYFHALMFTVFGVSFSTLIYTSLAVLVGFVLLLYRLFARAADEFTAFLVCLVTLGGFAFSQVIGTGNYNYVTPYTYEAFHGLVLSVVALGCLWRWIEAKKDVWAWTAGVCAGGVFLTKPDLFLALAAALAVAVLIARAQGGEGRPRGFRWLWLLVMGLASPSVLFVVYYSAVWNFKEGLKAVVAAWLPLLTTSAAENLYYRHGMGLDQPLFNLEGIALSTLGLLVALAFLAVCARFLNRNKLASLALGALLMVALYWVYERVNWGMCGWVFWPTVLFGAGYAGWRWWGSRHTPEGVVWVFPLLWSVFALGLMPKMGLFTRITHYGFYLGMPAAVFVVYELSWLLPRELERFQVNTKIFRVLAAAFLAVGLLQLTRQSEKFYALKYLPVGSGGDRILTPDQNHDAYGIGTKLVLAWLQYHTSPTNTLAVLPEGNMINYLSRLPNPTPYTVFSLPEVRAFGETNMLKALEAHSPDYVVVVHRDASEYGVKFFGQDPAYGYEIMQWVRTNYSAVRLIGHEPLQTNLFGIKIMRRNGLPAKSG